MYICQGRFSPEITALLQDAYAREGSLAKEFADHYQCVDCGRSGLAAASHRGDWHPVPHEKLWRQPVKSFLYMPPPVKKSIW